MAEEQFGTILTTIGKAKIANSALLGNKLVLKTLKIGDSNGEYYEPIESQTELKHEVYSCDIGSIKIDDKNPNWVKVETILSSSVGGFTIREVGICDADGDLIAISKYPESYKPIIENGAGKDICIRLIVEVSNAEQITLNLDPSVIIATKEDIDDLQKKIDSNTSQLNENANDINTINKFLEKPITIHNDNTDMNTITKTGLHRVHTT
ncbi:phage tail protein, partial [Clostridium butyricum]